MAPDPTTADQQTNGVSPIEEGKKSSSQPARIVLCLDGTGNLYSGNTSDTNIVKLYQKLDRKKTVNQYHYYQPGIGTYAAREKSVNTTIWGRFKRSLSQMVDQGLGTTFDAHVIGAYRFIMRYYDDGDKIYIFGFSRGAFTARFLARMIHTIGLLSKGNEEMVPFAYKIYQDYENGIGRFKTAKENEIWMNKFRVTFCRQDVRVHFLGLWDTVNSVGYFDLPFRRKTYLPTVRGTAQHVRHAVSIDERRCKFRVALLQQDIKASRVDREDIKEVYFAGNHGDIGGGWLAEGDLDGDEADDPVQLSDITLEWMITELQELAAKNPDDGLLFNEHVDIFLTNFRRKEDQVYNARIHDMLRLRGGESAWKVCFWNFLECIPLFGRLELVDGKWVKMTFPPNLGGTRDIPKGAVFHHSVIKRMSESKYLPKNQGIEALHQSSPQIDQDG